MESPYGVPPSGGRAHASIMIMIVFNALEWGDTSPAEAGTPNPASLAELDTEIQQGMTYCIESRL